jgi:hypothetical protein
MLAPVHRNAADVGIQVTGGSETSAVGASQISNENFSKALADSIVQSGLFAHAGPGVSGRYELNAFISRLSQPMVGFSMTVTMEVGYTLVDNQSHQAVWRKSITSQHTAAVSDAFAAVTRLRLATEGAAKENIQSLLRELGQLTLVTPPK